MREGYPSDISREQFKKIEWNLRNVEGRRPKKPKVDLFEVVCAIFYLLKSGCQWRMLPKDFPKWQKVYYYFRIWKKRINGNESIWENVLKILVSEVRTNNGRNEETSFIIVDAQSVKNTDSAEEKGYDAGKKVSGIKRHIGVDTQGLLHGIHVTTANVTDRDGAIKMFIEQKKRGNLGKVKKALVDGGYSGEKFANEVKDILGAEVEVAKRSELHKFAVIPKRWVVERSFSWLEKCRRLWKNCERELDTSLQMVVIAYISLLLRRF